MRIKFCLFPNEFQFFVIERMENAQVIVFFFFHDDTKNSLVFLFLLYAIVSYNYAQEHSTLLRSMVTISIITIIIDSCRYFGEFRILLSDKSVTFVFYFNRYICTNNLLRKIIYSIISLRLHRS